MDIHENYSEYEILSAAREIATKRFLRQGQLNNPTDTKNHMMRILNTLEQEVFGCLFLDNRNRIITYLELFKGSIASATIHPREVVREALRFNAAAVIFAHNHPSGESTPSVADRNITARLKSALNLIDVRVIDHIIVGFEGCTSLAEEGVL